MPRRTTTTPDPPTTPPVRRINIAIDADLHRELRIRAATDDMSLQDTVIAAIGDYLGR
jgi:hypothetical protein